MYYRSGTGDAVSTPTRWQHFSKWNDVMAAILKLWSQD